MDIPVGEARMFVVNDRRIGVYNLRGEYFALDDYCPHAGASLAHGIIQEGIVSCGMHHWRFCIRDGRFLDEDKPSCNVKSLTVRVIDGRIQIAL